MDWEMPHKTAKNPHRIVRVWITPGINSNNGVAVGHSGVGHNNHGNNQDVGLGDSNQDVDRNDGGRLEEVRNDGGNLGHHNSVVEVQRMLRLSSFLAIGFSCHDEYGGTEVPPSFTRQRL